METRSRSSHLWFLLCFTGFLSLSLLPSGGSIYTAVFFILLMDILKDKALLVRRNMRESSSPGIVVSSDLLVKMNSSGQGERTVEEYSEEAAQMEMVSADLQIQGVKLEQAIIPKTEPRQDQKLNRSIHPHSLTWKPSGKPYTCNGCLELGLGPSYCCETDDCNYILHEDCANVVANNSLVFHPFFKESNFMFYKKKPDDGCERFCDACGNDVRGFYYHCDSTGKDLHPCCLNLKDSVSDKGGHVTFNLWGTVPKKCKKCMGKKVKNNIKGWSYVSLDGDYCFHVSCFEGLKLEKWKENYFSEYEMPLQRYDLETQIPLTCGEMVRAGRSSKGSGKIKVFTKIATVALEVIVSVIFGNPAPLILTALGAISGN